MTNLFENAYFIANPERKDFETVAFEKSFECKNVKKATLYISSFGVYEAKINGKRVGDYVLAPGWTEYFHRLQYQTYDVTEMLKDSNTLYVEVGTGWTSGMGWVIKMRVNGEAVCFIAKLIIETDEGRTEICSDESWDVVSTPVTFATIYDGEVYDARIEKTILDIKPNIVARQYNTLIAQQGEKITEHESYPVKEIIKTPCGETVLDFGYNLVGYVEFSLENAKAGDRVVFDFAEILDKDGNFYNENYRSAKSTVEYIAKEGAQTYKPRFTFFGGRYIRLKEYPENIDLACFKFIVVHSDIKRTGYFECSNDMVNRLYDNIIRSQRGNYLDIPTDCPQRDERLGWTADTQVFTKAAAYNYDVEKFFDKWLADLAVSQYGDGSVPSVVPNIPKLCTYKSACWMDAATVCPWEIYLAYGNKRILERQYRSMRNYIEFLENCGGDEYMWNGNYKHYGDWLSMDTPGDLKGGTKFEYIAQCFFAYSTMLLIKAGRVLAKDVSHYEYLYEKVVEKFRQHYMKDGLPIYKTQTACTLALHFDLCEKKDRAAVADLLCSLIHEKGDTLTTGFVGTPYLLHALTETGHADLAYTLALQEKFPSWLYSVKMGATTIWEHWDGINEKGSIWSPSMNSYNHYAYGSVCDWMYGVMAGINSDEKAPGYKNIILSPVPDKRLSYVKASLDTRFGTVKSEWHIDCGKVIYKFTVPESATADITVAGKTEHVGPGEYTYTSSL